MEGIVLNYLQKEPFAVSKLEMLKSYIFSFQLKTKKAKRLNVNSAK